MATTIAHVTQTPAAPPAAAREHFLARLSLETDAADVFADLQAGAADFVLVDTRSPQAFADGHLPGARSLPHQHIDADSTRGLDRSRLLVTYCWGPGCNAATRAAARLAALGFQVKEMLGGIEYWQREGYPIERVSQAPCASPGSAPAPSPTGAGPTPARTAGPA
jgi:rhodanese-related sulfurtransferase